MIRMTSAQDPLSILLIEDSKGDAILVEKALQKAMPEAHRIEKKENLATALQMLAENEYDIALLDRSLPDVVGYSGLHSIQNMAPKLPVIFLTAYKDEETALECIEQGAQDYLFKDKFDGHAIKRAIQYAIIRKQFESVLMVRANYDNLTGLANRMLFESRLDMALAKMKRHSNDVGVLFMDLNRFKEVNDTLGHLGGDKLLTEVGSRIKQSLRPYDTAARFGGDEFAILIEGIHTTHDCEAVAQKIINRLTEPVLVRGHEISMGVSIGISLCVAGDNYTRDELIHQADAAMYEAKLMPQSGFRFYSDDIAQPGGVKRRA